MEILKNKKYPYKKCSCCGKKNKELFDNGKGVIMCKKCTQLPENLDKGNEWKEILQGPTCTAVL